MIFSDTLEWQVPTTKLQTTMSHPAHQSFYESPRFDTLVTPDPTDTHVFARLVRFASCAATEMLRKSPDVARYLVQTPTGVCALPIPTFDEIFSRTFNLKMTPELREKIIGGTREGARIEYVAPQFIAAVTSHSGPVLYKMIGRNFTPYLFEVGSYPLVFCFTHTSFEGLGAINSGRKFNTLFEPRNCPNKGVKAFVDVRKLWSKGIMLWCKNGCRDRVFCFSRELKDNIEYLEYAEGYATPDNLKKVHARLFEIIVAMLPTTSTDLDLEEATKHQEATKRMQRLFIDDATESDDE